MAERKNGSILAALLGGLAVVGFGIFTLYTGQTPNRLEYLINGGASILFGLVLLWWVFSQENPQEQGFRWPNPFYRGKRNWGIGFETITMVVTVLTAIVVIFTLT